MGSVGETARTQRGTCQVGYLRPPADCARRQGEEMATLVPRIALIGCGLVGQKRLNNLPPGVVTMACDLNLARASKLAQQSKGCEFTDSVEKAVSSPKV